MTELLDCYLPVFKQVTRLISAPVDATGYEEDRQACIELLEQAIHHASLLDLGEEEKDVARFAVIAWLDETILCSGLPWRHLWQSELLQRKYLNTTVAGERFFTCLEQMDPASEQARQVFLFCLQNGFHGQYSAPEDNSALLEVINSQRQLCLPQAWRYWPNDTSVTSPATELPGTLSLRKSPLLIMTAGLLVLYGSLFFLLHNDVM
ncbi:DotU family type IV/VI secretion system protein [Enterobacter mori]|uniref:DotU family type IV/VI secretion system protein n=1 Tax=Enterobacter mori TaxID=539813 RepID=UPI003B83B369